jgi:hypothetical protein
VSRAPLSSRFQVLCYSFGITLLRSSFGGSDVRYSKLLIDFSSYALQFSFELVEFCCQGSKVEELEGGCL